MNLETLDLLTQKIEKALGTIRALRAENQRLQEQSLKFEGQSRLFEGQLAASREEAERLTLELEVKQNEHSNLLQELARKDQELAGSRAEIDQRVVELNRVQDSLREKEEKIQVAADRLEQVMNSLEIELDLNVSEEQVLDPATPLRDETGFGGPSDLFGFPQR